MWQCYEKYISTIKCYSCIYCNPHKNDDGYYVDSVDTMYTCSARTSYFQLFYVDGFNNKIYMSPSYKIIDVDKGCPMFEHNYQPKPFQLF